ncbi:MAG: DUF898 family protein [Bacteroidota bacterium]|nr:DUF898 family protein [Bacteroidota bacterium]
MVNWLLTIITLGLYYPWAKARNLQFLYGSTALNNDRFAFHGTGREMFIGFIKTIIIFGVIYGQLLLLAYFDMPVLGAVIFYFAIIAIIPVAIHGSYRYRFSRTSWRGIRFGYRGDRTELFINYFKWAFFSNITLGIYGAWMKMKLRGYLLSNVRAGNVEFKYNGVGSKYLVMNIKGFLLTLITLGIYGSWWQKDLFAYYVDNLTLSKENQQIRMKSTATGGEFFKLNVVNFILFIFTLGFGYAWVVTRTMNFVTSRIKLAGNMDLDTIQQTEDDYNDATGDDMTGFLDINFII